MASNEKIEREMARDRGILSSSDRKWLLLSRDEYVEEHSRQYWGQRRDEVINRVRNGVLDFTLLFDHLEHDQRVEIFGNPLISLMQFDDPDFEAGIRDTLAFMIEGAGGASLLDEHVPPETTAERLLEEAFGQIAWRYQYNLNGIQLDVDAEKIPGDELLQRIEADEELTAEELAQLLLAKGDDVNTATLQEQIRAELSDAENGTARE